MRVACLFSGGKDSTYSLYLAKQSGVSVDCLLTLIPNSEESYLFHSSNIWATQLQAKALQIPIITKKIKSISIDDECNKLDELISQANRDYKIEGIVHGGIRSNFQKNKFNKICEKYNLKLLSPLWQIDEYDYMNQLLKNSFVIQIISVSSMGLDASFLGIILNYSTLEDLYRRSKKYGFNLSFEGGEAETIVLDCPIFKKRLEILTSKIHWDGQRGIVEISDISLLDK
ncbi:MAG TPA: diphthine--ammonia ligase [Nitrososphaeraceae archaeon]|nr:diphthine--ammonia ligase [Nitrososphaeraceae archaeon]